MIEVVVAFRDFRSENFGNYPVPMTCHCSYTLALLINFPSLALFHVFDFIED